MAEKRDDEFVGGPTTLVSTALFVGPGCGFVVLFLAWSIGVVMGGGADAGSDLRAAAGMAAVVVLLGVVLAVVGLRRRELFRYGFLYASVVVIVSVILVLTRPFSA